MNVGDIVLFHHQGTGKDFHAIITRKRNMQLLLEIYTPNGDMLWRRNFPAHTKDVEVIEEAA